MDPRQLDGLQPLIPQLLGPDYIVMPATDPPDIGERHARPQTGKDILILRFRQLVLACRTHQKTAAGLFLNLVHPK